MGCSQSLALPAELISATLSVARRIAVSTSFLVVHPCFCRAGYCGRAGLGRK